MIRARIIGAVVLVGVALAAVASTASGGTSADGITVWLQIDAQAENWEPIVKAANDQFEKAHPGVTVDVQYQTWGDHLKKFDATLAGGNAPDVIEMGNTEMTKYMAAGAFQDLTSLKGSFANSSTWLAGPRGGGRLQQEGLRRPVLRGLPRRDVPDGRVQEGEHQGAADARAVRCGRPQARLEWRTRAFRPSTSRAPTGTSR